MISPSQNRHKKIPQFIGSLLILFTLICCPTQLFAQSATTANIFGEVVDVATKKPVDGAIIVVTSPALQGEQTAVSDAKGKYRIDFLPPGIYTVNVTAPTYKSFDLTNVQLLVGRNVKIKVDMLPESFTGETITVKNRVASSVVDTTNTTTGMTMSKDYMEKVAVGRSFNAISEATPGAQVDRYGISFAGSTSPENAILVDGVNASNPQDGTSGTNLPLEFLEQVDVKVGGYMPEFGNSTGAVVNVITKIGGNEIHGSMFNYITPFQATARQMYSKLQTIRGRRKMLFVEEAGFEVGGAVLPDKLWFHVGFSPIIEKWEGTRSFYRRLDLDNNGTFDVSDLWDDQGNPRQEYLGVSQKYGQTVIRYRFTGKLTYNLNENHRISLGAFGNPSTFEGAGGVSNPASNLAAAFNGDDASIYSRSMTGGISAALSYDGKLLDKKLLVHSDIGYYRSSEYTEPFNEAGEAISIVQRPGSAAPNIGNFIPQIKDKCLGLDLPEGSKIIGANACPSNDYATGGLGYVSNSLLQRLQGRLHFTGLFNALGSHQVKAGFELQHVNMFESRRYTGGAALRSYGGGYYLETRRYGYYPTGTLNPDSSDFNALDESKIVYPYAYKNRVYFNNYVLFAQDSWNILDKVNVNGGVRVDIQDMYGGDGKGNYGARALMLTNVSPRVGVIYDVTGTGRSKMFASYGRFYELVPLQIANRSFPQEPGTTRARQCADNKDSSNPLACPAVKESVSTQLKPGSVVKNLQGQFVDMFQAGGEYQILSDLLAGVSYTMSRLGMAIEDMSPDDGNKYFIGNPGVGDGKSVTANDQLTYRPKTVAYPKPERRYDAVSVYLAKSLSQSKVGNLIGNISYTWSMLRGHYSGLFDPSTGQLDPNINADLDLASLLDNRYGLLPGDRTHMFKIDISYVFIPTKRISIVPNISFRAGSGTPYSYLGAHEQYGSGNGFIIGRGAAGRTDMLLTTDAGVNLETALTKDSKFSFGVSVLNFANRQYIRRADENFTRDAVRPIRGGDESDLPHIKRIASTGRGVGVRAALDPNFANSREYQTPLEVRINAKFTF